VLLGTSPAIARPDADNFCVSYYRRLSLLAADLSTDDSTSRNYSGICILASAVGLKKLT